MPYCTVLELFQASDCCRNRVFSTFEELQAFLEARYQGLLHQLSNLRAKHADEWAQYDARGYRDFGCSAILQSERGDKIQVGVSKDFWLLFRANPYRPLKGVNEQKGIIPFYLPEWTEFYVSELHPAAAGAALLKRWLDTGVLE